MSSDSFSKTYIQYLIQAQAKRRLPKFPQLDAVENRMLGILASRWHEEKPITVTEAMVMLLEISTTTAHRRLKVLRKKGMIDLKLDSQDNRVKYVVPTKATHRYFAQLGQCMGGPAADPFQCVRQYMKYLHLTQDVRRLPICQKIDAADAAMLDRWAVAWGTDVTIGVLDALSLIKNGSSGSSIKRFYRLRAIGMIEFVAHGKFRNVVPTEVTQQYFVQLGRCIHQALVN